jgi:hypothetical protein
MGILRHPRTFGELRDSQDGFGRPKRGPRMLPTVLDDIFVDRSERNWKRVRKTKWKAG